MIYVVMDNDLRSMAPASLEPRKCSTGFEESYKYYTINLVKGHSIGFTVKSNIHHIILWPISIVQPVLEHKPGPHRCLTAMLQAMRKMIWISISFHILCDIYPIGQFIEHFLILRAESVKRSRTKKKKN